MKHTKSSARAKRAVKVILANAVAFLILLEGSSFWYLYVKHGHIQRSPSFLAEAVSPKPQTAAIFPSQSRWNQWLNVDGREIFDVDYLFDEYGWRAVDPKPLPHHKNHLFIFGGGAAFGVGLSTEETLASKLADRMVESVAVYNFAIPGSGLGFALRTLQNLDSRWIKGAQGSAVFFYDSSQTRRIGSPCFENYGENVSPRYVKSLGKRNVLKLQKFNFWEETLGKACGALAASHFFKLVIKPFVDQRVDSLQLDLLASMIKQIEAEYLSQFPGSKFYLVVNFSPEAFLPPALEKLLTESGVEIFDLSLHKAKVKHKAIHPPVVNQPTADTVDRVSKVLLEKLNRD